MAGFNRIILVGNLTRDIELRQLPSGTPVAEGGIATNRKFKTADGQQKEDVCFLDWSCFGRAGEIIQQYAAKGHLILLEGRLQLDRWEDNDGNKRSKHKMIVENFQFLNNRDSDAEPSDTYRAAAEGIENQRRAQMSGLPKYADKDIPF